MDIKALRNQDVKGDSLLYLLYLWGWDTTKFIYAQTIYKAKWAHINIAHDLQQLLYQKESFHLIMSRIIPAISPTL